MGWGCLGLSLGPVPEWRMFGVAREVGRFVLGARGIAEDVEVEGGLVSVASRLCVLVIFTGAMVWLRVAWCPAAPSSAVYMACWGSLPDYPVQAEPVLP